MFLGDEAGESALLDFFRKLPHGLLCDDASLATCKRRFGIIEICQKLCPRALRALPIKTGLPSPHLLHGEIGQSRSLGG
jgi:hypothetical protein